MSLCESQFDIRNDGGGKFSVWFDGRCIAANLTASEAENLIATIIERFFKYELLEMIKRFDQDEELKRELEEELERRKDNLSFGLRM